MSLSSKKPTEIRATSASSEDSSWIDFQLKERQSSLQRLEDAAKFLSGLASVSLTIMLSVNKSAFDQFSQSLTLKIGVLSWLISIVLTLGVVLPFRYNYIENSADSIKKMNQIVRRTKYALLTLGALFYLAGICILSWLYLTGRTSP
jgi:hypothetical protein